MKKFLFLLGFAAVGLNAAPAQRARNVILFLGDAGGLSTLHAASIYGYNEPRRLFIQQMPHFALAETSSLNRWVTDSAAGMTAIVTGRKTKDQMVSVLPAVEGGQPPMLKTILEYAEERGLATGVITNKAIWDATPAACYAHVPMRLMAGEIFEQLLAPRFGDGPEVVIGGDMKGVFEAAAMRGVNAGEALASAGYEYFSNPADITAKAKRVASIYSGKDFEPKGVLDHVLRILQRNRKGYFLMVEWDMHTDDVEKGLKRALVMDDLVRHVAGKVSDDTLIIFAADHSFDLRTVGGSPAERVSSQLLVAPEGHKPPPWPVFRMANQHTGEEVLVAAQGPGASRLRGFISNTDIFHLMMKAFGWKESP